MKQYISLLETDWLFYKGQKILHSVKRTHPKEQQPLSVHAHIHTHSSVSCTILDSLERVVSVCLP